MRLYLRVVLTAFLLPCLFLSLTPSAEASIVIVITDDGTDLMFNMTGTMDLTGSTAQHTFAVDEDRGTFNQLYSLDGTVHRRLGLGTSSIGVPGAGFINAPTTGVGTAFGFSNDAILWDDSFGTDPGLVTVDRTWTVSGRTVASQFGTLLDSGLVTAWTHGTTGETISLSNSPVSAVPEPSSFAMFAVCLFGMTRRRR